MGESMFGGKGSGSYTKLNLNIDIPEETHKGLLLK